MSKVYPLASQGSRSEAPSGAIPAQPSLRFGDPQRVGGDVLRRSELVARELVIRVR